MSGERAEDLGDRGELAPGNGTDATDFARVEDYTKSHKGVTGTEGIPGSGGCAEYAGGFSSSDGNKFSVWVSG